MRIQEDRKMKSAGLASKYCTELGPAQPQLVYIFVSLSTIVLKCRISKHFAQTKIMPRNVTNLYSSNVAVAAFA